MNADKMLTLTRAYTAIGFVSALDTELDHKLAMIMSALDDYWDLLIRDTEPYGHIEKVNGGDAKFTLPLVAGQEITIGEKRCPSCGEVKPISHYHMNKARGDGHEIYCKACKNKKQRENKRKKRKAQPIQIKRTSYADRNGCIWYIDQAHDNNKAIGYTGWKKEANGNTACVARIVGDKVHPNYSDAQCALDKFAQTQPNWKPMTSELNIEERTNE